MEFFLLKFPRFGSKIVEPNIGNKKNNYKKPCLALAVRAGLVAIQI